MSKKSKHFYKFDAFSIDVANRSLTRNGRPVAITMKAFDTLLVLVENRGQVLDKDVLMLAVWPDTVVEENNLNQQVSTLRRLLGGGPEGRQYIETIPRRGYRFTATVSETLGEESLTPPKVGSIAVLPFKPLAPENKDVYLELGIADTLITKLSNIKTLSVRPTSSILGYLAAEQDPLQAGNSLKVDVVLEGRFIKSGEGIRVTVQLLRVDDGALLWADSFDEQITNILRLQDAISERVVTALALNLTGQEKRTLARRHTENTEAYQLYLKGRYFWYKWTPEGWKKAQKYFKQAIEKDPGYALAHAGLADAFGVMGFVEPFRDGFSGWREAAVKALELDDTLAEAHIAMGALKMFGEWDRYAAEDELIRAIELAPNNALAHDTYALILGAGGRAEQSIEEAKRAQELDPLSPYMNTDLGMSYYLARRFEEAVHHLHNALELDPNHLDAINYLGAIYEHQGLHAQAMAQWHKALTVLGEEETARAISQAYARSGYRHAVREWLDRLLEKAKGRYVAPIDVAVLYERLGDKNRAIRYLEKAYQDRSFWLAWIRVEPRWDSLRSDADFQNLLLRFEEETNMSGTTGNSS